ncbi:hypothetical protein DFH09DRAFT_355184 [Mycena vulgaris]|nr:hypothetical protein DFH09DRAFT_355184 [Mycena vulgaris]
MIAHCSQAASVIFFKHQSPERKPHSNEYACSIGTRHNVAFGLFGSFLVYAFGYVCLELYTGQPPFAEFRETAVIAKAPDGVRPEWPTGHPTMSDALWGLVNDCWAQQSTNRPLSGILCQCFVEGAISTDCTPQVISNDSKRRVYPPSQHSPSRGVMYTALRRLRSMF